MKVVSVFPSFANKGGAEDIAISLGMNLNNEIPVMMHLDSMVFKGYESLKASYEKFNLRNIRKYHKEGYVFLSHHRKTTTYLLLLSKLIFGGKLRIVHVAHNTFSSLKRLSLFPKNNIAVSNTVKENMNQYFGIPNQNIQVIYNGLKDYYNPSSKPDRINKDTINVLFLGRVDPIKQQVEFVKQSKGKLKDNVRIYFGGVGSDFENLKQEIGDDPHYVTLGLINPYYDLPKFDYVCLFSIKEGLPLSLIEGEMFGKPLITNDIPQSLEVNLNNHTGFVNNSWETIINCLNSLPHPKDERYKTLSANARANYVSKFDFDKMIDNYKSYMESIIWE